MGGRRRRALQGRYSRIAQGASPGLIIGTHLLSPIGAAQPQSKCFNARVVSAAPLELDITFGSCIPRVSFRALPSFHPGLCESVVPTALIMHLNFDAVTLPASALKFRLTLSVAPLGIIVRLTVRAEKGMP